MKLQLINWLSCSSGWSKKENKMKLTPPKNITFWISVILGVYGILGALVVTTLPYAVFALVAGFVLLALGNLVKGL
jgi:hypothetical protein